MLYTRMLHVCHPFYQVMATLQSALADPHGTPAQRRTAYRVMMGYILGLSDASLAENLSTIVVRGRKAGRERERERERGARGERGVFVVHTRVFFCERPQSSEWGMRTQGQGEKHKAELRRQAHHVVPTCASFPPQQFCQGQTATKRRGERNGLITRLGLFTPDRVFPAWAVGVHTSYALG